MELVTIIIPNLNGVKILPACLDSVKNQTFKKFKVVVIDNNSQDQSLELLKKNYPWVETVSLKKNLGFAKAVNLIAKREKTKYIAFLNNDTKVDHDWLKYLIKSIEKNKLIAAVCPKLLRFTNPQIIDNASDSINIVGQAHPVGLNQFDNAKYNKPGYVFGVSGAASLYRKEILAQLNYFDEQFFFYFEDVDFALRAQLNGYKFYYEPRSIVYHYGQKTAKFFVGKVEYWRFKNSIIMVIKNFPFQLFLKRGRWFKIPLVWFHTFYFFLKRGLVEEAFLTIGYITFNLPVLLYKRYKIQKNRKVSIDYFDGLMEDKKLKILQWQV